jgi:hypothetical protein
MLVRIARVVAWYQEASVADRLAPVVLQKDDLVAHECHSCFARPAGARPLWRGCCSQSWLLLRMAPSVACCNCLVSVLTEMASLLVIAEVLRSVDAWVTRSVTSKSDKLCRHFCIRRLMISLAGRPSRWLLA